VTTRPDAVALDGRALGKRGAATRRRLRNATSALLETGGVRDLRVVDIAREVGTSPATFYQYFRDVEEAVLMLTEEVGEDLVPLRELLDQPWSEADALVSARSLVSTFLEYWDGHRAVLRTRNLAAQEGDQRFRRLRNASLQPLVERLAGKVRASQEAGRVATDVSPIAAGAGLVAMMERMAAFHTDLEPLGATRDDVIETTARIIYQVVIGQASGARGAQ
jgi:AcrR family transcriptional regulator